VAAARSSSPQSRRTEQLHPLELTDSPAETIAGRDTGVCEPGTYAPDAQQNRLDDLRSGF
jgi:hypothetical protein